jgi:hypothetical protein
LRDSVLDGVTGVLARTDDEFIDSWAHLANGNGTRARLAAGARARAAQFTWDRAVERFAAVLEEAVEQPRAAQATSDSVAPPGFESLSPS